MIYSVIYAPFFHECVLVRFSPLDSSGLPLNWPDHQTPSLKGVHENQTKLSRSINYAFNQKRHKNVDSIWEKIAIIM